MIGKKTIDTISAGFKAQEVEEVLPDFVRKNFH